MFIDRCSFIYYNGSHCYNPSIDFVCGDCLKKFCYDHAIEHEHTDEAEIRRSSAFSSMSSLNDNQLTDAQKSSFDVPMSPCSSCNSSCACSCSTSSSSSKSVFVSDDSVIIFHPIAVSTQAILNNNSNLSATQDMQESVSLASIDFVANVLSSRENNQLNVSPEALNESIDVLPNGVVSNDLLLTLQSTLTDNSTNTKRKKAFQNKSHIKDDNDRLNRVHFFLKNIKTNMTYLDAFTSIATMFPLIQIAPTNDLTKIRYLCVAGSIRVVLNYVGSGEYLYVTNGDRFNEEMKLLANGKYIESSIYTCKKENFASDDYRKKQEDVATAAFEQESFNSAVDIVKKNLKFEYLVRGKQIRENIDYELRTAKKRQAMEYAPPHDVSSFIIPDEHRQQIQEWLDNDFQKRIENKITRSRCLFMVGPTKHGNFLI
ncbi:unnamed protein product [Adineta ricciae]|uniref:Geminivirus AL1 replication-associated protein central domain-containing protein n=1 Tax=Adineta ricciae TaxID=249248 RepID=A0A815CHJ3_ADIRI|nr:unnamed protein product [Adineta ricciae]